MAKKGEIYKIDFVPGFDDSEFRKTENTPPLREMMIDIVLENCSVCGKEIEDGQFAALDLEKIVDGRVYGRHFCQNCLREGK